jgi:uncharacterized protein (TIGR02145 family)
MINQQIQHYRITSELGKGGMATVYLAHDLKFDTKVALKVLNKEFVLNDNIRKRFLAEAKNMYRMSHANVVKVTDLIDENDNVSFVMEYIDGETLKDYIERKGRLSDDEIRTILLQMLQALIYVHNQNLIHRDIKPSNFMIDKLGRVKLMDFGIAKNTDSNSAEYTQTGTGLQMGTPMYMSPEQIRSTKEVNHLTDIYSVGVVLWHLVMGHKPYNAETLSSFDLQAKIVNDPLPKTQTFWDEMIQKATEKKAEFRFKSGELWIKDLNEQKENSNIGADNGQSTIVENKVLDKGKKNTEEKGNSKVAKQQKDPGTKRKWVLSLSILLSALVFCGIWFYWSSNQIKEVTIGNQVWMAENLNVDHFRNGDPIPEAKSTADWKRAGENKQPAWCYFQNNPKNGKKYGKLYNWYAVKDKRRLAPEGWHVPSIREWRILSLTLGGGAKAAKKMKSKYGWKVQDGTNSSGFNGLCGGYRSSFYYHSSFIKYSGSDWWTSSGNSKNGLAFEFYILTDSDTERSSIEEDNMPVATGFHVRCVRN